MNAIKRNSIGINDSSTDGTGKVLAERLPREIIVETDRLEKENAEFNRIEGIDNLNIDHGQSDSQTLDEMVADFMLEYPDFDIFEYVDPALNAALDAELAKNALNAIDCDVRQPDFNLNRLARDDSDDESCVPTMPERYTMGCDQRQKMAGLAVGRDREGELQSMRIELQQQKQLISELQKQFNNVVQQTGPVKQMEVEQLSTVVTSTQTQSKNAGRSGIVTVNNLTSLSDYDHESNALELESTQQEPLDAKVIRDAGKLKKVVPRPRRTLLQADNSNESAGNMEVLSSGGKARARNVKNSNSSHKDNTKSPKPQGYSCDECGKRFSRKNDLTRHFRIHTGEKPYKCEVCNQSFTQKQHLSTHLLIHVGEKPFTCDICQKMFRHKVTLSDHMNVHSGKKPHKCKKCEQSFFHSSQLSRHLKLHVGE